MASFSALFGCTTPDQFGSRFSTGVPPLDDAVGVRLGRGGECIGYNGKTRHGVFAPSPINVSFLLEPDNTSQFKSEF